MRRRNGRGFLGVGLWASVLLLQAWPLPASANIALGACCLPSKTCIDISAASCSPQGGIFVGEGTACVNVDCSGKVAAPVFSILGMIGAVGALSGFGVYRLIRKRSVG